MFIDFGKDKCPFCGNFGKTLGKEIFHCEKCEIAFNEFAVSSITEPREHNNLWN